MPVSEAQKRARNKWDREHMTILGCRARLDFADDVRKAAAANGTTVSAIIHQALEDFLKDHPVDPAQK